MPGGSALDNLAVQAPLIVVLCLAISALFWALQKINGDTIADLRKRLDGQDNARVSALTEMKDAIKEFGYKLDRALDKFDARRGSD